MKRNLIVGAALILASFLTFLYLFRVPLRGGYLGPITVAILRFQTNGIGQVTAQVAIANRGGHVVHLAVGTQILQAASWVDSVSGLSNHFNFMIEPDPYLGPGSNKTVSISLPVSASPWRAYVMCEKHYPEHWSTRLRWISDAYILKRRVVEHFFSPEIQASHP